jgi:hypothetical protein
MGLTLTKVVHMKIRSNSISGYLVLYLYIYNSKIMKTVLLGDFEEKATQIVRLFC